MWRHWVSVAGWDAAVGNVADGPGVEVAAWAVFLVAGEEGAAVVAGFLVGCRHLVLKG